MSINAILFDLDGTLLDTAPDLINALNHFRNEKGMENISMSEFRPLISMGSKEMVKYAFSLEEQHPEFATLRTEFLDFYQQHIAEATQLFPNMEKVLKHLDQHDMPWGIVTNKLTRHTMELLKALNLAHRPVCIICGDTLKQYKPDPEPILHACQLLNQEPDRCIYVGDSVSDVVASKGAGTLSLVALYGYIDSNENPYQWQANGYINDPLEIIEWI